MGTKEVTAVFVCAALSWSLPAAGANDPNAMFAELYGGQAKKVAATGTRKDDVEFARKVLEAAANVQDDPAFQAFLYEKAYALGIQYKPGYATAVQAMQRLAQAAPKRRAECNEKLLKAYELQYRTCRRDERSSMGGLLLRHLLVVADAELTGGKASGALVHYRRALYVARTLKSQEVKPIAQKVKAALARQRIDREVARLEKSLAADRTNGRVAHQLVMLHLVERDDPNRAAELLPLAEPDQVLQTYVPLLKKPWKDLPEQAALELASWYADLATKAGAAGKPRMLARARTYCRVYLGLHERDDAPALKAKGLLKKVEGELAQYGEIDTPAAPGSGTVAPPKGMPADLVVWTQRRDALPPAEQVEAIQKKLSEINRGVEVEIPHHKIEGDRIVSMEIRSVDKPLSILPLFGLKLEHLNIERARVPSLEPLKGMPLKRLHMRNAFLLKSLRGLERMPLEELRISQCQALVDIRALRGLPLRTLALQDCDRPIDLGPLAGLPLESMSFENSDGITSIAALKGMKLTSLHLGGCTALRDVRVILNMPLTDLDLSKLPIRSLDPLKGLKLEALNLGGCQQLRDISALKDMPLRRLSMGGLNIRSLDGLKGLKLESLSLDRCLQIRDLSPLRAIPLKTLGLNETNITSLASLKGANIKELGIGNCRKLRSLEGLEGMPLRMLHMSRTPVRSLKPLRGLPLEDLQMEGCRAIRSLEPIQGCPLKTLGVAKTRFATAAVEAAMKKKIPTLTDFRR